MLTRRVCDRCRLGLAILAVVWLGAGCLPVVDAEAAAAREARLAFARAYGLFWQEEYVAWRAGVTLPGLPATRFVPGALVARGDVAARYAPAAVQESFGYYFAHVERPDWGTVYLYHVTIAGRGVWAVRVTTDGDDGWLELYDDGGRLLGAARSYIELLAWGTRDEVRAMVLSGAYPQALADRERATLWQVR